jgi:hypothetical protein
LQLFRHVLTSSFFSFNGQFYEQTDGVVMGSLTALVVEAADTSEMLVDIQLRTRQYIPEDSELHTRRRENLKSHV